MVDFAPQADLSSSWALEEDAERPRIEDSLERADADVGDALEHIARGDGAGSLALLPTVHERLRQPPRHEDRLTEAGRELFPAMLALSQRGDKWAVNTPYLTRRHSCGQPVQVDVVCHHCGQPVTSDTTPSPPTPDRRRAGQAVTTPRRTHIGPGGTPARQPPPARSWR
jgi:hypothetical protein